MSAPIIALDHFAGTGWGVASRWLGIREYGVEIMPDAIRTRRAVGFRTIYRDVWAGLLHAWLVPFHVLYIASPPCQTFSIAGSGSGRKALDMVLMLIASGAWKDPAKLRAAGAELGDDRTALVLTPLAHIWAHRPRLVALEQVPTVLPIWEAMAEILRGLGYSVWTGNLQAEQYGVPQTRKRAILMARLDGPVAPPVPTHSRYYSRDPKRLDPGVQKWVSMAEALGWGMTARPYPTVATGTEGGGTDPAALGGSGARKNVYAERAAGRWTPSGDVDNDRDGGILRLQASDASTLQTFPRWGFERPATTVAGNSRMWAPGHKVNAADIARLGEAEAREKYGDRAGTGAYRMTVEEAATLQTFPRGWGFTDRPAVTVGNAVGRGLIGGSGAKEAVVGAIADGTFIPSQGDGSNYAEATRISVAEAGALQTFPAPFPFQGNRGKQFLQIGNAVPPLLAYAILSALVAPASANTTTEQISEWDEAFAEVTR